MNDTQSVFSRFLRRCFSANTIGFAFLIAALGISMYNVLTVNRSLNDPDTVIIRMCHWQLELGFRDALQNVIDEYNMLHEKDGVKVVQMPVTEKVYQQWLNVHLISGTAPDLIEKGMAKMAQGEYTARFFVPLGEYIVEPNPYNKGTELENISWKDSFIDGMRGGFDTQLQGYYCIPMAFFNTRLFYNVAMLEEIQGTNLPPQTLGELLSYCDAVRAHGEKKGKKLIPIAGSKYVRTFFREQYRVPFTYTFGDIVDVDYDNYCSPRESYAAFATDTLSFSLPRIRAWHEATKSVCDNFPKGWMAMDRQQAAFLFVQGRAAIIASGSWDAESLFKQAAFPVAIAKVPLPGENETYSEFKPVRANEARNASGGGFGVYKFSKNKKWAIDFLQFFTSRKYNEQFNRDANWIPVVVGTEPSEEMKNFASDPTGYDWGTSIDLGGHSTLKSWYEGKLWLYLSDEIPYEEYSSNVTAFIRDERYGVHRLWFDDYEQERRNARVADRLLAVLSTCIEVDEGKGKQKELLEKQYDAALIKQLLMNNGNAIPTHYEEIFGKTMPEY